MATAVSSLGMGPVNLCTDHRGNAGALLVLCYACISVYLSLNRRRSDLAKLK